MHGRNVIQQFIDAKDKSFANVGKFLSFVNEVNFPVEQYDPCVWDLGFVDEVKISVEFKWHKFLLEKFDLLMRKSFDLGVHFGNSNSDESE